MDEKLNQYLTRLCLALALVFNLNLSLAAPIEMRVSTSASREYFVTLENSERVPMVVSLTLSDSESGSILRTTRMVVKPLTTIQHTFQLTDQETNPKRWNISFRYRPGFPVNSEPKLTLLYPIQGEVESLICQSDDGALSTHKKGDFAIDICAPLGTPVIASHEGIVMAVETSKTEGGTDLRFKVEGGNFVQLIHESGLVTYYGHLAPNTTSYKIGDRVMRGSELGRIGVTGFTAGPHIHFQATYLDQELNEQKLNPDFVNGRDEPIQIRQFNQIIDGVDYQSIKESPTARVRLNSGVEYNKYIFGKTIRWFEYYANNKIRNQFIEVLADERYYYLQELKGRFGLAIPKLGGLVFLLDSQGRFNRPHYHADFEATVPHIGIPAWLASFEADREVLRRYQIGSDVFWIFSTKDKNSSHQVFRELPDAGANYVVSTPRLAFRIPKKGGKVLFSRDGGAKWFDYKAFRMQ